MKDLRRIIPKMSSIKGLGIYCSASKNCEVDKPCSHCLLIGQTTTFPFSPEEQKEIDKFLKENKELMNDLAEMEEKEKNRD